MLLLHAVSDVIADPLATLGHNNNNATLTEVKSDKTSTQGLPTTKEAKNHMKNIKYYVFSSMVLNL